MLHLSVSLERAGFPLKTLNINTILRIDYEHKMLIKPEKTYYRLFKIHNSLISFKLIKICTALLSASSTVHVYNNSKDKHIVNSAETRGPVSLNEKRESKIKRFKMYCKQKKIATKTKLMEQNTPSFF